MLFNRLFLIVYPLLISVISGASFSSEGEEKRVALRDYAEIKPKADLMRELEEEVGKDPEVYDMLNGVDTLDMASGVMISLTDANYNRAAVRLLWLKAMEMPGLNTSSMIMDIFWIITDTHKDLTLLKDFVNYCLVQKIGEEHGIVAKYIEKHRLDQLVHLPAKLREDFRVLSLSEAIFLVKEEIIIPLLSEYPINHPRINWNIRVKPGNPTFMRVAIQCRHLCAPNKYPLDFISLQNVIPIVFQAMGDVCRELNIPITDGWLSTRPQWVQGYARVFARNEPPTEKDWSSILILFRDVLQGKEDILTEESNLFYLLHHLFTIQRDWMEAHRDQIEQNVWNTYRWSFPEDGQIVPVIPPIRSLIPRIPTYRPAQAPLFLELAEKYGRLNIEKALIKDRGYNRRAIVCLRLSDPEYFAKYGEKFRHNIIAMMYLINYLKSNEQFEWLFHIMRRSDPHFVSYLMP